MIVRNPDFLDALRAIVGPTAVLTDPDDMAPYATDWRGMFVGVPRCVVRPASTAEVAAVVRLCAAHGIAIVPAGGNTGLSGGATPDDSGTQIVLSLARMHTIRAIDAIGETMEVEAGCILSVAQQAARDASLLLPISLASEGSVQIGGALATNAGGTNVLRYGMARSRLLGLEVVLADGSIVSGLRALRKDNAGYDWKHWFIGSEGTLGIITAAVLQLSPPSHHRVTALIAVNDVASALAVLGAARQAIGDSLSAFELMSGAALMRVATVLGRKAPIGPSTWYVLIEASTSLPSLRDATEALFADLLDDGLATDGVIAESDTQAQALWALRESITEAEAKTGPSLKHDISVPVSAIPAFVAAADTSILERFPDTDLNVFGHVGDGNLHYNVIVSPTIDRGALTAMIHDLVLSFGGSISAEHGIGQYRVAEFARLASPIELALAYRIKAALDPAGLLNPGKMLAVEDDGSARSADVLVRAASPDAQLP